MRVEKVVPQYYLAPQLHWTALEQMDFTKLLHYLEETGQGKLLAGKNPDILKVSRKLKRPAVLVTTI